MSVGDTGELAGSETSHRAPGGVQLRRAGDDSWRLRRAVERVCVLGRHQLCAHGIGAAIGVSPRALAQMMGRAPLPDTPMSSAERRKCLTALSCVPVADGLIETYWYSVDPVVDQVRNAIKLGDELAVRALAGGEVAADVFRPWRMPTRGLLYATELIDLSVLGLEEVTVEEATLIVRVPADPTVWASAAWWHRVTGGEHGGIATVDPVIVLEDLTAGIDSGDGARERLIDWIVGR